MTVNLVFLASKGIHTVISFYLSYEKPCEKLALGQNCTKKSNSVTKFLLLQTEICGDTNNTKRLL